MQQQFATWLVFLIVQFFLVLTDHAQLQIAVANYIKSFLLDRIEITTTSYDLFQEN